MHSHSDLHRGQTEHIESLFLSLDLLTGQMAAAAEAFLSGTRRRACSFAARASNTVFKVDGRFYSNLESCIKLAGVNSSFRNSSVFRQYAFPEVDALLDHLIRHVRRFVTSNPLRPTYDLLWLPSDVKRTMVYILAVTTISVQ